LEIAQKKSDRFIEVTNNVLTEVLGEGAAFLIYRHLEKQYSLLPDKYAERSDLVSKGLRDCLGCAAAPIENKILFELHGITTQ
jgi:hypothetical protein